MDPATTERRVGYALLALSLLLLFVGLNRSGIWDPWEIDVAEVARSWSEGRGAHVDGSPLGPWLTSLSFQWLGVREWTGRLPLALAGLITLAFVHGLGRLAGGRGVGVLAVVVCATTPLFLINSRLMLGASPHFALQTFVAFACAHVAFTDYKAESQRWAATGLAMFAVGLSTWGSGALLGPLPPLLGFCAATSLDPARRRSVTEALPLWLVTGALGVLVWQAVRADAPEYSVWLGGGARGGEPPTFEREVERLFHNFAPWSALLIPALGVLLARMSGAADDEAPDGLAGADTSAPAVTDADPQPPADGAAATTTTTTGLLGASGTLTAPGVAVFLVVWLAASYAVTTLFASRYGSVPIYAVGAVSVAVALTLSDLHRSGRAEWLLAALGVLFVALLLRDYAMFPGSPITGTPGARATVPEEGFDTKLAWGVVAGVFALGTALTFLGGQTWPEPSIAGVRTFAKAQWQRGPAQKAWWLLLGLLLAGILVFGVVVFAVPDQLNSLAVRIGRYLLLLPPVLIVVLYATPRVFNLFARRPAWRLLPIALGGLVFGAYFAFGFIPELSRHLSPRDVFETYNTLRGADEPLGEYQVGGRAGSYYTDGEVRPLRDVASVVSFLTEAGNERVWAVFPSAQLVDVDLQFRRLRQEHLFVADARNARIILATNRPIEGRENQNLLATSVLRELPREPQHLLNVRFEDKIELIGYDLELPGGTSVGPSQSFAVTWYWRALASNIGGYKIFLHIDGHGQRLNGDHDPVSEHFPVSRWQQGDIIVDRQELDVAANYPPGEYGMWIGFFSGSSRLALTDLSACTARQRERCKDSANRLNAGPLEVR
ncbi:MAG: glycosyltransferase family 39 protein [Sandaracinaceae bacterium]|nr:glycosyltransferase family 39 protein [Sandaracinaceae bacterium]